MLMIDPDELEGEQRLATKNRVTQVAIGSVALQQVTRVCACAAR